MKAMTKRLLSMLVVLAMVLSMTPVTGLPAIEAKAEVDTSAAWDATENPYCPICNDGQEKTWEGKAERIGALNDGQTHHFYLTNSIEHNTSYWFVGANAGTTVHLNMNGHSVSATSNSVKGITVGGNVALFNTSATPSTFTSGDNSNAATSADTNRVVYISGTGKFTLDAGVTVTGLSTNNTPIVAIQGGTFTLNGGTVSAEGIGVAAVQVAQKNLQGDCAFVMNGGTVTAGTTGAAIISSTSSATVTGYGAVTLNNGEITGGITMHAGTLTLGGDISPTGTISVQKLGKLTVSEDWNGVATASFVSATLEAEGDAVPATNGAATATFKGTLREFNTGRKLIWDGTTGLKLGEIALPPVNEFNPDVWGGLAYCPVCGGTEAQTWTALDGTTNKNVGIKTNAGTLHYYLKNSYEYGENAWFANANNSVIHLNMNGESISVGTKVNKGILAQGGGSVAIFNTDTANTSNFTAKDNGDYGVAYVNVGTFTLGSNVKLYSTNVNAKPVVTVAAGTFTMEAGSEISAEDTEVVAVQVNDKRVAPDAIFEMNGGTITAGTTGVAVVNGSSSTSGMINEVILNDGTVTGKVTVNSGSLTLDKKAKPSGVINVGASGKLVVNETWTGSAVADFTAGLDEEGRVLATNGVANGYFEGTLRESGAYRKLVWAGEGTTLLVAEDYDFNPGEHNQYSYCEACKAYVEWTPLNAPLGTAVDGGGHYYLTEAYNDNDGNGTYIMAAKSGSWYGNSVCLHLNGRNIPTSKAFYLEGQDTKLYILGNGGITYTGNTCMFWFHNSTKAYLYGGTYSCEKDVPVLNLTDGMSSLVHLYGTTAINGSVTLNRVSNSTGDAQATTLYMHDSATVNSVTANAKGKLYLANGWKGSIGSVTYKDAASIDAETKLVSTDNAVIEGTLGEGYSIKLFDDRLLKQDATNTTQLVAVDYDFGPDRHNGYSYCKVCNAYVTWDKVTGKLGNITYTSDTMHYYLDQSIAFAGTSAQDYFMQTTNGKKVHFNMNGWSIRPVEDAEYAAGPYLLGSMELFNTSATESFWAATCVNAGGNGEMGEFVVRNSTTEFVLHDGVTLEATGSNTAQPVVGIYSGTFSLNGGTVTAAGKGNVAAVQPRVHNTKSAFVMNSGEIICGTGGTAIRVGQSGTAFSATTYATLNGGTITGTVTANVGTVTLDETASPSGVINVGANGKLEVNSTWTGKAAVDFAEGLVATDTGLVNEANGYAAAEFESGYLRDFATARQLVYADGNRLQLTETVLKPGQDVFDPEMWAGQAYCPECQTNATEWTAVDDCTDKRIGIVGEGIHHYYIRDNLTCGKTGWFASAAGEGKIIHLNMNGKKVSVGENATTGGINLSGGEMEIFNTSTDVGELEVVKNSGDFPGMVYIADGEFVLGDKVKLTGKEINGSVPFMYVLSGTFRMDGGEVSAEFMAREAVWVKKTTNKASAFIMNGGTVTGGTGDAVHVGTSTDTGTVSFEMHDGTINGTVYVTEYCTNAPVLSGKPTLTVKLDNATETARLDVEDLTGGNITLAEVAVGVPFATNATADMKDYFSHANSVLFESNCLYVGAAKVDGVWYATTAAAVTNAGGKVVVMGGDASVELTDAETDYYIDCAGNDITVTGKGKLYAMDSANVEFDEDGRIDNIDSTKCGTWNITDVTMAPVTRNDGDIYVLILNEDSATYSAHYLDIRISAVNLRTSSAGLYYTAEYKCDATLAANIRSYGVGLSIHTMPTEALDGTCSLTQIYTNGGMADKLDANNTIKIYSGAVTNIFTNDAENSAKNAENAAIEIYANAYLEIDTVDTDNTLVFGIVGNEDVLEDTGRYGDGAVFTMGKVLEAINTIVDTEDTSDEIMRVKGLIAKFRDDWSETFKVIQAAAKYDVSAIMKLETASSEENA